MQQGRVLGDDEVQDIDEKLHAAFEKRRKEEAERYMPTSEIIGTCSCCTGAITCDTTWENINPALGGSPQYKKHSACFCTKCGIVFNEKVVRTK